MYIAPNTTIKLYSGVPLDDTYNHTLYFQTLADQTAYFHSGIAKYSIPVNSYQRVEKGKMRIEKTADDLYDCNYLAFQNTNYGNKWFYAFITKVEYVNNVTTEISFEIDSMQTYFFDVRLKQCFVEREHPNTDEIGDNIQPEPVELGEYVTSDYGLVKSLTDYAYIVAIIDENNYGGGQVYDRIYSGAELWAYKSSDLSALQTKISSYISKPEQIISIYLCPKACIKPDGVAIADGGEQLTDTYEGLKYNITLNSVQQETNDFGGYVPKNKKLYTYPYNYLTIDNAKGQSLVLRYEFFDNLTPVIELTTTITMPVQIVARPCSYKGLPSYDPLGGYTSSKSESLALDNYPICSWSNDSYAQWVAQKTIPLLLSGISRTIGGAMVLGGGGMAVGLANSVMNVISQQYDASIKADICRGNISDGSINVSNSYQNFYKSRTHITKDYAITIDNFFTMFGYAVNRVKIPYRNSRPHWNYVKTKGCVVHGLAPVDDIKKICSIYDNGITFWHNANEVGDYSYNNAPT